MSVKRNAHTSKLRVYRLNSPHKATVRAFLRSAPGSRRSCADGALNPLRRTKRTSKPGRLRRLRNDRKGPWSVFFHTASSHPPASLPGKSRRRRHPSRAFVRRNGRTIRLRRARACASCSSPAPCAGGFRESGLRTGFPPLVLSCIWRARRPGFFPGRSRTGCDPVREGVCRIFGKGLALCARPPCACGVCAHTCVSFPDPCEASCLPPWGEWNPYDRRQAGETSSGLIPGTASSPRRGARPRAAGRCGGP